MSNRMTTPTAPTCSAAAASNSSAPELIRLDKLPSDWKHSVSINSLALSVKTDQLVDILRECGGPIANIVVHQAPDRQWATAQFFCESDATRFCQSCDGRALGGIRIGVRRLRVGSNYASSSSQATPGPMSSQAPPGPQPTGRALDITALRAIELVNHYLGFDGWSHELLELSRVEEEAGGENEPPPPPMTTTTTPYRARVRVHAGGVVVSGTGVGGDDATSDASQAAPSSFASGGRSHKAAITNALKAALQKLAIIRFPKSGKVVVRAIDARDDESENVPTMKAPRSSKRTREGEEQQPPASAQLMPPPPPRPPQAALAVD